MMNKLLDGQTFLVDIVDELQGVVEQHTMQINNMMPSFYDINSRIDLVNGVANGARVVIMGFTGTLDAYKMRVDKLAKRLKIAEEKIREQAEELARYMDTVPAIQHMMTAVQTEDAVQHESSACQNSEVVRGYRVTGRVHRRSFRADKTRLQLMCCALVQEPGCLVISEGRSPERGTGVPEWT